MCERNLEADEWANEFQFLAGQTASEAWSSFHRGFQTARTQNPYREQFSHGNNFFLRSEQKHPHFSCSFQQRWQMQTSTRLPNFFWTLWWFIGEKQKVIWCVRWEECCGRSDMGTGVRPVLFNGRRHFWLKAACWEPPLRTCANLETAHTHINPFLIRYTHRQQQHVWAVYMQQVKACERGRAERQREKQKKRTPTQCCSALWEELLLRLF